MKYYYCVSKMMVLDFDKIDSFISEHTVKNGIDIVTLSFDGNSYIDFLEKSGIVKHFTEKTTILLYSVMTIIYTGFQFTDLKKSKIRIIQLHLKSTFKGLINFQKLLKQVKITGKILSVNTSLTKLTKQEKALQNTINIYILTNAVTE